MSTTTIRLPEDLKTRVARAAKRSGTTSHSFILEAIAEKTEAEDRRDEFHALAKQRFAAFVESGKSIPWSEMHDYLLRRVAGKPASLPIARKLTR